MSSFVFFKIPFEGKIEAVNDLIKDRELEVFFKRPEKGTLLMKVPDDIEEELKFHQDMVFDEKTYSKFGIFTEITESEYESAQNIDINDTSDSNEKYKNEEKSTKLEEISQKIESSPSLYKEDDTNKEINDQKIDEKKSESKKVNSLPEFGESIYSSNSNTFEELGKNIAKNYKDPFDFFFNQNYLINFFILSVICLVIFQL